MRVMMKCQPVPRGRDDAGDFLRELRRKFTKKRRPAGPSDSSDSSQADGSITGGRITGKQEEKKCMKVTTTMVYS